MKKITFTNIFTINGESARFSDLSDEEKIAVANYIIRKPLETLGNVRVRETA